jgi:hypothetical protein
MRQRSIGLRLGADHTLWPRRVSAFRLPSAAGLVHKRESNPQPHRYEIGEVDFAGHGNFVTAKIVPLNFLAAISRGVAT